MLYLFWYNTFIVLYINVLYNYLRQGAVVNYHPPFSSLCFKTLVK